MISIVIAAYNEQERIGESLVRICSYMRECALDFEIVVVDDGSSDSTSEIVEGEKKRIPGLRLVKYEVNRGKGYALRQGVMAAAGEVILLSDADLSTPIDEISRFLPFIHGEGYDIVIGSRALKSSLIIKKQPWWRRGMGKIFNRIVRLLVMNDFNDTQCGFKMFSATCAKVLFRDAVIDRFAFDVEILMRAKTRGMRILEMPVKWVNSPGSKVNPLSDSLRMLYDLVRIRLSLGIKEKARCAGLAKTYISTK